jgi:molecular chaperone DnaK (HSP70)
MGKAVGIDLGTTFSEVAVLEGPSSLPVPRAAASYPRW